MEKKRISIQRLITLEGLLGAVSNPDMFDWDIAEIPCDGGEELLTKLQVYRRAYLDLKAYWEGITGHQLG